MDKESPKRKPNRKKNYDYSTGGAYFLTICTRDRINLFWNKHQPNLVGADIIGQTKRYISKRIGFPVWQKSFHDHIIRNKRDYDKIAEYVYKNPIYWQYDCFYNEQ